MQMLEEICAHIHNYFTDRATSQAGMWRITDGGIDLPFLKPGQYFRITGSTFNDGVYQYPPSDLADEVFYGAIWPMRIPRAFLAMVTEIEMWQEKYGAATAGPYQSESFGGYSYTLKGNATGTGSDAGAGWQGQFRHQLNQYRKLS